MVWNPLRLIKTLAHFGVVTPWARQAIAPATVIGDLELMVAPRDDASEPGLHVPRRVWLKAMAAAECERLAAAVAPAYDVEWTGESAPAALVNTAVVVCPSDHLGELINQMESLPIYCEAPLLDFQTPSSELRALWGSLDDGVMGGVSASQVQWQNGLRFGGQVSTANNGGFASIRTRNLDPPLNLSQWQGMALHLQGDGQRYKWILRDNPGWDSLAYCQSFDTEAQAPVTVRTPFREMVATRRARTVPDAPPLNPSQIYSMQLMLSKFEYDGALNPAFQAGTFGLTVQRLGVFRQGPKPLVVLPGGTADLGPALAAAGLTGAVPQGEGFKVIGASDLVPPQVSLEVVQAVLQALA